MLEAFGDLKGRRYLIEYTLRYVLVICLGVAASRQSGKSRSKGLKGALAGLT